jgi:hypothetical protein
MKLDATELVGQFLSSIENRDYSWFFMFSGGDQVSTESPWRLVTCSGIYVTSEDHGHQFGLPAPVDATERVRRTLGTDPITDAGHDERTGDLIIRFADQRYLHFLQLSCGYESWTLLVGDRKFVCMGGGEYASLERRTS